MGRFLFFIGTLPLACALTAAPLKITPIQSHRVWAAASGFPSGYVYSIAQTNDGYLWIGSSRGLIRYDGIGFSLIRETDPAANFPVLGLTTDSTGQLWAVDDLTHLFRFVGGHAARETDNGLHRHRFAAVATNRRGSLLFASELQGIVEYEHGSRHVLLDPGAMPGWPTAIAQTADGAYWIGTRDTGVFRLSVNAGAGRAERVPGLPDAKINCLLPIGDSTLLVCTNKGLLSLHGGTLIPQNRPELNGHEILALAGGRDGGVWIGADGGLFRADARDIAENGTIQALDPVEAAAPAGALFEDRDGNLWIGGPDTMERYRSDGFDTYSSARGLPSSNCGAIYVDDQDGVWFAPWDGGLFRLSKGFVEQITAAGLKEDTVYSISGGGGDIWVARKYGGLTRLRPGSTVSEISTYRQSGGLAQDSVYSIYRAADGTVWAGTINRGVSRLRDNTWRTFTTGDGLPSNAVSAIAGNADGSVFVGTPNGIAELGKSGWIAHTTREGLPPGAVESLFCDAEGTLWIGTSKGISFLQSGAIHVPLDAPSPLYGEILGITESGEWLWISTGDHVLRVNRAALLRGAFEPGDYREFTIADGLASVEGVKRSRSVFKDNHGRVWLSLHQGISVLPPSAFTHPAFPVTIRLDGMVIDGRLIPPGSGIRVAPGPHRMTFRFAGVNVSNPEDVRYRYRLENAEAGWSEPTAMRQVDYTDVPPGHFTFKVQASNPDGVWGEQQAAIAFDIEPAFWQNRMYQFFGVVGVLLLGWGLYRYRLYQIAQAFNMRLEERVGERTRIARDLHDTLLQSFQGLMLRLQVVDELLPPGRAKEELEQSLERADQAIAEGRSAVHDLRSSTTTTNNLAQAIRGIAEELAGEGAPAFRLLVEGAARDLHPILRDEVYRIAREALRNAFTHARAHHVEAEITYGEHLLRLRIRDDGDGIPPGILEAGRSGHYGMEGMRERARQTGAKLDIWSGVGTGTQVDLSVPASIAYGKSQKRAGPHLFRRKMR